MSSQQFSKASISKIHDAIHGSIPKKTISNKNSFWRQFERFCAERNYTLLPATPTKDLVKILCDWAYNMQKSYGEKYKESVIKTFWNVPAKILMEKYFKEFNRKIDPFADLEFKKARNAENVKRKELQNLLDKRKQSTLALTKAEIKMIRYSNAKLLAPYMQLGEEHHSDLMSNLRQPTESTATLVVNTQKDIMSQIDKSSGQTTYHCTLHVTTMNFGSYIS